MQVLLTSCSYVPLELPLAAGLPARRLFFTSSSSLGNGDFDGLLPRDFCPYARAFMRKYECDELLVIAGSCDAMRRVYDAVRYWGLANDVLFLDVPRTSDVSAVGYFADELRQLATRIGRVEEPCLRLACEAMNAVRGAVAGIFDREMGGRMPASMVLRLALDVNELLSDVSCWGKEWNMEDGFTIEAHDALVGAVRAEIDEVLLGAAEGEESSGLVPVGVSGTCLLDLSLVECLEEAGLDVVFVDSCLSQRMYDFSVDIESGGDIYEALAKSYLSKPACPRMFMGDERISRLSELAAAYGAKGLVYFTPKFCDLGCYEFPEVKRGFRMASGLPSLLLEGEYGVGRTGQALTRAVAFREMLEGRKQLDEE